MDTDLKFRPFCVPAAARPRIGNHLNLVVEVIRTSEKTWAYLVLVILMENILIEKMHGKASAMVILIS